MSKDPNGFYGVTWGARPSDVLDLIQVTSREHVQEYELKQGPPQLGEVTVDSVRLFTFDGQFARVAIHYRGEQTHRRVLAHNRSHPWVNDAWIEPAVHLAGTEHGSESHLSRTIERGFVSIESRSLAARLFNDLLPEHDY